MDISSDPKKTVQELDVIRQLHKEGHKIETVVKAMQEQSPDDRRDVAMMRVVVSSLSLSFSPNVSPSGKSTDIRIVMKDSQSSSASASKKVVDNRTFTELQVVRQLLDKGYTEEQINKAKVDQPFDVIIHFETMSGIIESMLNSTP